MAGSGSFMHGIAWSLSNPNHDGRIHSLSSGNANI